MALIGSFMTSQSSQNKADKTTAKLEQASISTL
jgi:hypothetical protein